MNIEKDIIAKYGGSSLANAGGFIAVGNIINKDCRRRIIVPSAPGKEKDKKDSVKTTDLLINCGELSFRGESFRGTFDFIEKRFLSIADELEICIDDDLEAIKNGLMVKKENEDLTVAWAASRGEWLSGRILARYLEVEFVDAAEIIKFHEDGVFNQEESYRLISQRLRGVERFVVPGYYGQDSKSRIRTFPRGGSDITGAYLAGGLNAVVYENWTDTNGVLTADPNIVPQAATIPYLLYEEMAELGMSGAKVFHYLALGPVWDKRIPVNVRNTFNPKHPGTWIRGSIEK
ncbi:hypothetical protein HYS92_01335 [Candidatus Daviesbacteria bacterium]|nr:hypothetical protein [Candidatus Daviesbacteria bacterium]